MLAGRVMARLVGGPLTALPPAAFLLQSNPQPKPLIELWVVLGCRLCVELVVGAGLLGELLALDPQG
jgi:hypothetical protein